MARCQGSRLRMKAGMPQADMLKAGLELQFEIIDGG